MDEPVQTPRPPNVDSSIIPDHATQLNDTILSSSPAFGTPAYPIANRPAKHAQHFAAPSTFANPSTSTVLPILLPPQTLRPLAFRTLTKKHNLTLTSSALRLLAAFIGRHCGSGWREEGLAERVLDEVAKAWKRANGGVIVEDGPDKKLTGIFRLLEPCISGGRLDTLRLSRTNSSEGSLTLSRTNPLADCAGSGREEGQTSLGVSSLEVDDGDESTAAKTFSSQSARSYMKVILAHAQPRLMYSNTKKTLEPITTPPSLFPSPTHKIAMFRNRYNLVHQRLLRNELFQNSAYVAPGPPSLQRSGSNVPTISQAYKLTPIANLLGRSGTSHLLLGMLVTAPTGDLALTDLTGSITLDLSSARPVQDDGAWYCPGMLVLVEGIYEEDGSNSTTLGTGSGVGGLIGGMFRGISVGGPPAERRDVTLGINSENKTDGSQANINGGFGWVDFLGVGSEKAMGVQMRRIERRVLAEGSNEGDRQRLRTKIVILGECTLDCPRALEAIRGILASYSDTGLTEDIPLSIVFMGNFVSAAAMAGSKAAGGSIEYKEQFDELATVLTEFSSLLATTTFIFVPGDNDPWPSAHSAGAATAIPREGVPEIFTSRIRRAVANANSDAGRKDGDGGGEAIWAGNPARVSLFGPAEELVLFRDDITGRMRRSAITLTKPEKETREKDVDMEPASRQEVIGRAAHGEAETDVALCAAAVSVPSRPDPKISKAAVDTHIARKLVKTILDQGHLSPFPLSTRPVFWDYAGSLNLYPLPTALVLADAEAPAFAVTYEGCHVLNPGRVVDELGSRRGLARWAEYDVRSGRGIVRETRF